MIRALVPVSIFAAIFAAGCSDPDCTSGAVALKLSFVPGTSTAGRIRSVRVVLGYAGEERFKVYDYQGGLGSERSVSVELEPWIEGAAAVDVTATAYDAGGAMGALLASTAVKVGISADSCNEARLELGSSEPEDAGVDAGVDGGTAEDAGVVIETRTVTGMRVLDYRLDDSTIPVPQDLSGDTISATYFDGVNFNTRGGVGLEDGTYTIEQVIDGSYLLRWRAFFIQTSAANVDLGRAITGRPDQRAAITSPTILTVDVTGLAPWGVNDLLWVSSVNVGASSGPFSGTEPLAGATTGSMSIDYTRADDPWLIEDSAGDEAVVTQLIYSSGPPQYWAVRRAATVGGVTMRDGMPTQISADLTVLPTQSFLLDWRIAEFEAAVSPGVALLDHALQIDAVDPDLSRGISDDLPYILRSFAFAGAGNLGGTVVFANPYPDTALVISTFTHYSSNYVLPGATQLAFSVFDHQALPVEMVEDMLRPILSPPRDLMVDQLSADVDRAGISTTPTLSWTAPAGRAPEGYRIAVHRLSIVDGATTASLHFTMFTKGTSIHIPPGLLMQGSSYFAQIASRSVGGADMEQTPFIIRLPFAESSAFTRILTP